MKSKKISITSILLIFSILMLCSSISIPNNFPLANAIYNIMSKTLGISIVTNVGTYLLTQTRYSMVLVWLSTFPFILFFLAVIMLKYKKIKKIPRAVKSMCILFAISMMSCFLYGNIIDALKMIYLLMVSICIYFLEENSKQLMHFKLLNALIIIGCINSVIGILQFLVMSGGALDIVNIRTYRPDGLFGDSIISAFFSIVTILTTVVKEKHRITKTSVLIIGLSVISGVLSGARTFYFLIIVLVVELLVLNVISVGKKIKWIIIGCIIITCVLYLFSSEIQLLLNLLTASANEGRNYKKELSWSLFVENPLVGIGTGQYAKYESSYFASLIGRSGISGTNPHNIYLQIMCENGLLGFVPFLISILNGIRSFSKGKYYYELLLLSLYLIIGFSLGIFYSIPITSFIWIILLTTPMKNRKEV